MSGLSPLPMYQCHKKVYALKIKDIIGHREDGQIDETILIVPEDVTYSNIQIDHDYYIKHKPQPGGYYVVYEDGYKSYSPAKAFEEGYSRIN